MSYKGDDTVGRLMHDFGCKESKDMYYPVIGSTAGMGGGRKFCGYEFIKVKAVIAGLPMLPDKAHL